MRETSQKKIASIHIARMNKEAKITKDLSLILNKAVGSHIINEVKGQSKSTAESTKGWEWAFKDSGASFKDAIQDVVKGRNPSLDSTDPLSKLVALSLSKTKDPFEQGRILGEFNNSYAKKDIEGMASALGQDKEVVLGVLLWYLRNDRTASDKTALFGRRPKRKSRPRSLRKTPSRAPIPSSKPSSSKPSSGKPSSGKPSSSKPSGKPTNKEKRLEERKKLKDEGFTLTELDKYKTYQIKRDLWKARGSKFVGFTEKSMKVIEYLTGGPAIEWLVKLLPKGYAFAKPLKWAWWAYFATNHWAILSTVAKWATTAYAWFIKIAGSTKAFIIVTTSIKAVLSHFLFQYIVGAIAVLLVGKMLLDLGNFVKGSLELPGLIGFVNSVKLGFSAIWTIIKTIFSTGMLVAKKIKEELVGYIEDNAPMFSYLIKKYSIDPEDSPKEIKELHLEEVTA